MSLRVSMSRLLNARLLRRHVLRRADHGAEAGEQRLLGQRCPVALATPKSITFGTGLSS
jgi:hypothetical protein